MQRIALANDGGSYWALVQVVSRGGVPSPVRPRLGVGNGYIMLDIGTRLNERHKMPTDVPTPNACMITPHGCGR